MILVFLLTESCEIKYTINKCTTEGHPISNLQLQKICEIIYNFNID